MNRSRGFSLIELTIVIVVLGILAVTALPRFLDVTEEAQNASVQGMSGGFASGVMMAQCIPAKRRAKNGATRCRMW